MKVRLSMAVLAVAMPVQIVFAQSPADPASYQPVAFFAAIGFAREDAVGYHALIGLDARTPSPWLRLRLEGLFADMGGDQKAATIAFTTVASALKRTTTPYILASFAVVDSHGPQRGWSLGLGWRFTLAQRVTFLESRLYSFHDPAHQAPLGQGWRYFYTPISMGLRF